MGVVYEARQTSLNRRVALKVLGGGLGQHPKAVQRFKREAEAAASLHHTNIVPIHAIGEEDGTHFYAMELVDGPSMDMVLQGPFDHIAETIAHLESCESVEDEREVPIERTVSDKHQSQSKSLSGSATSILSESGYFDNVARQMADVADALQYAHDNGVVHRDIKPSNLLVGPDGRISINDFGLARVLEAPNMTATGEMLGTPAYMSPEQITAGRTVLDHRTDIYSLGATLYEVLTLQPPFQGERRDQLLTQILHKDPTLPRRINKKIPVDLETICLKAMDKDPDKRYQTASDLAKDLDRYFNRFEISARRVGLVGKGVKWVRRHPGVAAATLLTSASLVLAIAFAIQASQSEKQRISQEKSSAQQLARANVEHALERASIAATSGDLTRAHDAIIEAEKSGATSAQVRMLRGQVAFFQGDYEQAITDLSVAKELEPTSPAPRALIALTYLHIGDLLRHSLELEELVPLPARSEQDRLFKAYAHYWSQPQLGLELLDRTEETSRSPLARAIRADVTNMRAEQTQDSELGDRAMRDIRIARDLLPDNPMVLAISLFAYSVNSHLQFLSGSKNKQTEYLGKAREELQLLRSWQRLPYPSFAIWEFLSRTDQQAIALEFAHSTAAESPTAVLPAMRYANALCRAGRYREAKDVLGRVDTDAVDGGWLAAYIDAELSPEDVTQLVQQLARSRRNEASSRAYPTRDPAEQFRRALLMFGETELAHREYKMTLGQIRDHALVEVDRNIIRYGAEVITEHELLAASEGPWDNVGIYTVIGLNHLGKGNRTEALNAFRMMAEQSIYGEPQFDIVYTIIKRMEQDSKWPPWITQDLEGEDDSGISGEDQD